MKEQTVKNNVRQEQMDQDHLDPADLFINDIYWDGEPLTLERMREFGWPTTLEEAMARMDAEARKQAESAD